MPGNRGGGSFTAQDVIGVLRHLFAVRGTPQHARSDNDLEFVAKTGKDCSSLATGLQTPPSYLTPILALRLLQRWGSDQSMRTEKI